MRLSGLLFLAGVLATSAPWARASDDASDAACVVEGWAEVVADIDKIRRRAKVAGFALLVVDSERIVCVGYRGLADRNSGRPVDDQTWFRIGSVSKTFTALGALRLAQAGLLNLGEPLSGDVLKYVPDNRWANTNGLNVGQLLQHSAGLMDMSGAEFNYVNDGGLNLQQALAISPQSRRVQWPPGLHTSYSNSGAGVVGLAMEAAADERFESLMREAVFDPLGMAEATFERSIEVVENLATGYNTDGVSVIPYWHIIYRPAAGLNVRPAAMAPYLQMFLRGGATQAGRFLSESSMRALEDPSETLAAKSGLRFGRGMGNYHYQFRGRSFHGHGGDADGYLAHYAYSKDRELAYFLVINAFQPPTLRKMRDRVQQQMIAPLPKPSYPAELELPPKLMEAMTGAYIEVTRRFGRARTKAGLRVVVEDGRLHTIDADGDQNAMIAVTAKHFRRPWQSVATMAMLPDGDGGWVLQGEIGNYRKPSSGDDSE